MEEAKEVKAEIVTPQTTKALSVVVENTALIHPLATPTEAKAAIEEWEALKAAIVSETDIRREKRKQKNKETGQYEDVETAYLKKSAWRKMGVFFGLQVEVIPQTEKIEVIGTVKLASVSYKATAKNGVSCDGDGHCGSDEPGKMGWTLSNLAATAHTRAYSRAVSNLVGGGQVSAEEVSDEGVPFEASKETPAAKTKRSFVLAESLMNQQSLDSLVSAWDSVGKAKSKHEITDKEYQELAVIKDTHKATLAKGEK